MRTLMEELETVRGLLNFGTQIKIPLLLSYNEGQWTAAFEFMAVKIEGGDERYFMCLSGGGKDPTDAMLDYAKQIAGKRLYYNPIDPRVREFDVPASFVGYEPEVKKAKPPGGWERIGWTVIIGPCSVCGESHVFECEGIPKDPVCPGCQEGSDGDSLCSGLYPK